MWPAVVTHGEHQYPCTILDLSEMGARLESLSGALPMSPVKLQCEKFGSLDGRLVWIRGKLGGMRFDVAPAEIVRILKPLVPGLDRREQGASLPVIKATPRQAFGRRPAPAAPCEPQAEAAAVDEIEGKHAAAV